MIDLSVHKKLLVRRNALTRADRAAYAHHRRHLTATILRSVPERSDSIRLLGAGNCNDVDLQRLMGRFEQVHLVDIDAGALKHARLSLPKASRSRLHCHANVDLTGLLARFRRDIPARPTDPEHLAGELVARLASELPAQHGAVVSCCLLTQLGQTLADVLGRRLPRSPALESHRDGMIFGHLRLMNHLVSPGGICILANDLVSSAQVELARLGEGADLAEFGKQLVEYKRVRPSADPVRIRGLLAQDPVLVAQSHGFDVLGHWLWTVTAKEQYFVQTICFRRRSD
ncbi:MAG: hypothetical protein V3V08_00355 [Nannocystaceae bacterium]